MSELVATSPVVIEPAMPRSDSGYADAVWIGGVDDAAFLSGRTVFGDLSGYRTLRLLVRSGRSPRGFVELPISDGRVERAHVVDAITQLPPARQRLRAPRPPMSVVLCTLDRPDVLHGALRSVLATDYPDLEVIVVDNNPGSGVTEPVVRRFRDSRLRLVPESRRGLAIARNTGVRAARNSIVAFTDDDVIVDRFWLQGIADGFAAGGQVGCVSGMVPTGEIASSAQAYFDRRVSWARSCRAEVFSLAAPPAGEALFPFQVARFGTGANFAVKTEALVACGGFDEGLGVGSACGGGEDIDIFVRILLAGYALAYEPSAIVWHKHRVDVAGLVTQIANYGKGLGAWLTKLALNPRTLAMVLRRLLPGIRHLRQVTRLSTEQGTPLPDHYQLWRVELRAVFGGPVALARSRLRGARATPLAGMTLDRQGTRSMTVEKT